MRLAGTAIGAAIMLVCSLQSGLAGNIYHYTDEKGVRHYTDTAPQTDRPVQSVSAYQKAPAQNPISILETHKNGNTWLTIENHLFGAVEVKLSFDTIENLTSAPPLPKRFVVPPTDSLAAVQLRTVIKGAPTAYRYRYRYILGPPNPRHDPKRPYVLPFAKGSAFKVSQAFHGRFSHNTDSSRFAVDFPMPVGTPIVCARSGVVVMTEDQYVWGGADRSTYEKKTNHIRVLHDDGTMAYYGHLKRGSIRVRCGDRVSAGQRIADSGDTGFSQGPHLHFVIQKNSNMRWVAVPFQFQGANGRAVTPRAGETLQAH